MAKQITQFDLLVSCPSDVKKELEVIKETVDNFNRMYGTVNNASIMVKHWSTDSYPQSGGSPQKLLNSQFVLDCDAAVAVFWTRFGTPTDEYGSGTEEEIEELLKSGKQVFLYFSDCEINPSSIDNEQYNKVSAFRKKYKDRGIYWTYSNIDDFRKIFLNHLSLHFVKILTNNVEDNKKQKQSKLQVKGITNGKIKDKAFIYKTDYLNTKFFKEISDEIYNLFTMIKNINITTVIKDQEKKNSNEDKNSSNNLNSSILGEQLMNIGSMFLSEKINISQDIITLIKNYTEEHNIHIQKENFFNTGNLSKQPRPMGGGPYGIDPSYSLVGSEDEKNKYNKIWKLYNKIKKYKQYQKYFSALDSKYFLELILSNLGTSFDEDVDIKIFIKKGLICTKDNLPFPDDDILETINTFISTIFKPQKVVSVNEYSNNALITNIPSIPSYGVLKPSHEEKVKNSKKTYNNKLNGIFCYEYYQDDNYDILCYNQEYIKQNTSFFFPSVLVLNSVPVKIEYEITSKHYPYIIKKELKIISG
ncbi:MAG: hypothetical protein ACOCRK_08225 [bacterium]